MKNENRILVIGDSIVDVHIQCEVDRISPEAPVPVCLYKNEEIILGGAANVAKQVAVAFPCTLSYIGGRIDSPFFNLCCKAGLSLLSLRIEEHYEIPEKARIWSNGQQVCRIDKESDAFNHNGYTEEWAQHIIKYIYEEKIRIVVFSDYNKGTLNDDMIQYIVDYCSRENVITILDPKRPTYRTLKGLTIVTPNNAEISRTIFDPIEISHHMDSTYLIHTKGSEGMDLYGSGVLLTHVSAHEVGIADTCGAGDTVVAFLAMSLSHSNVTLNTLNDLNMRSAMNVATHAAAKTVAHHGNYTLPKSEAITAFALFGGA